MIFKRSFTYRLNNNVPKSAVFQPFLQQLIISLKLIQFVIDFFNFQSWTTTAPLSDVKCFSTWRNFSYNVLTSTVSDIAQLVENLRCEDCFTHETIYLSFDYRLLYSYQYSTSRANLKSPQFSGIEYIILYLKIQFDITSSNQHMSWYIWI